MCGIGGILRVWPAEQRELALRTPHAQSIPEAWLDILDDAVKHRGPDGQGRFRDRTIRADGCVVDVAFVHRRLSIIDHVGGHQPMVWRPESGVLPASEVAHATAAAAAIAGTGEPGDLVAVLFNGCIYNHRDLRAELQSLGHRFTTDHSDTEVLIHGWRQWGAKLPERLEGMFALAIWDRLKHSLFVARDFYGEKPLSLLSGITVCCMDPEYEKTSLVTYGTCKAPPRIPTSRPIFAFASSPAAMLRLQAATNLRDEAPPADPAESEGSYLQDLLAHGYAFRGKEPTGVVEAIESASWRVFGLGRFDANGVEVIDQSSSSRGDSYFPPTFLPEGLRFQTFGGSTPPPRGQLTADRVDLLLRQAVERRVEADVPLGAFLSGGVDSSLVSLYARQATGRLRTFCVRMPDPRYDESEHAAAVARIIDSDHSTLDCHPDPAQDLQRLITQLGLPFGDSSLLPAYWVSKAAREHVTVALTGDGGDELFIGYERQMAYFPFERWKWALAAVPLWALRARDPKSMTSKARRMVEAARADDLQTLGHIFMRTDLHRLFKGTRFPVPSVDGFERCIEHVLGRALGRFFPSIQPGFGFELCRVLRYLSEDLLVKADTASMAAALEARAPFLDTDLAAAVHAANPLDLIPDGERKGLLREVARRYLPAAIVDRPKMGFAIPIGKWFRTDYGGMRTLLLDHLHSAEPFGSVPLMPGGSIDLNKRAIRQMLDEHLGTGLSGMFRRDHSQRLYMLLVLSIWAKWLGSLR